MTDLEAELMETQDRSRTPRYTTKERGAQISSVNGHRNLIHFRRCRKKYVGCTCVNVWIYACVLVCVEF